MYKCKNCKEKFYEDVLGVKCSNLEAASCDQEFEECCPKCGCTELINLQAVKELSEYFKTIRDINNKLFSDYKDILNHNAKITVIYPRIVSLDKILNEIEMEE